MTRALVLSGGGVKGAYQAGALEYIINQGYAYSHYYGISVGALNCSYMAMYANDKLAIKNLCELWQSINNNSIWKHRNPIPYLPALWKDSVFNQQPLIDLVKSELNLQKLRTSGKKLKVGAVSLNTGKYKIFDHKDDNIVEAVLASSAFPIFFRPIEINGEEFTDGGIREVTPINVALDDGIKDIDVIMTSPKGMGPYKAEGDNTITLLKRVIAILNEEVSAGDLRRVQYLNKLVEQGDLSDTYKININILRPAKNLTGDSLDFNPENIDRMMDIGYKDAKRIF